jgi:hypothetical protein
MKGLVVMVVAATEAAAIQEKITVLYILIFMFLNNR